MYSGKTKDIFFLESKQIMVSYNVRKLVFGVSDQVRHKLGCTTTRGC